MDSNQAPRLSRVRSISCPVVVFQILSAAPVTPVGSFWTTAKRRLSGAQAIGCACDGPVVVWKIGGHRRLVSQISTSLCFPCTVLDAQAKRLPSGSQANL